MWIMNCCLTLVLALLLGSSWQPRCTCHQYARVPKDFPCDVLMVVDIHLKFGRSGETAAKMPSRIFSASKLEALNVDLPRSSSKCSLR